MADWTMGEARQLLPVGPRWAFPGEIVDTQARYFALLH